ncbi:hypothetical protein [Lactococcus garvieae]
MKDKHLYAPKKALEEQLRFQKLAEGIILSKSYKFATFGYAIVTFIILWFVLFKWLPLPLNFRLPWTGIASYGIGLVFSNYRPDGKSFPRYLWDAVLNFIIYGRRGTWYKGVFIPKIKRKVKE